MKERDIVRHRTTGEIGVIIPTVNLLREAGPWSVVFDGATDAEVVLNIAELEVVGSYHAEPDERGCGRGQGAHGCRFLGLQGDVLLCLRFSRSHWIRVFTTSSIAKRSPNLLYPQCKDHAQ